MQVESPVPKNMAGIHPEVKAVAVCDTEPIAIEGLRAILSRCADLRFGFAGTSLLGCIQLVQEEVPAVLIIDNSFGTAAVTDCLKHLRDSAYAVAPVVWGDLSTAEARSILQHGALGVVHKSAPTATLIECLRAAAAGITWTENNILWRPEGANHTNSHLTARETQVLALIEKGLGDRDIAVQLGITLGTAKLHVRHLFAKARVHRRTALMEPGLRGSYRRKRSGRSRPAFSSGFDDLTSGHPAAISVEEPLC